MFCRNCGASVNAGSRFCNNCGASLEGPPPQTQAQQPQAQQPQAGYKKPAGFFTSPAGIALVVILGVAVLGGLILGIVLLATGGSDNKADAATMEAWEAYEELLEDDSSTVAKIDMQNTNYLFTAQEELKKSQEKVEALKKTLAKSAGTGAAPGSQKVVLVDALQEALDAYDAYIAKMNQFMGDLIWAVANNQLTNPNVVNNLNNILAELQNLAKNVRLTAGAFIDANELLAGVKFDPAVLAFASAIAPKIEAKVAELQASEAARLEAERQAAEAEAARLEAEKRAAEEAARTQYVTCPLCGGVGSIESGDGRYICPFCGGSGSVTRAKANTFDPMDWVP